MPINGIYPPILQSTQPAFLINKDYPIYFTLQNLTSYQEIKDGHIEILVVKQANNKSVVDTVQYPNGIICKSFSKVNQEDLKYRIDILYSDLSEKWEPGCLYKVQIRFGSDPIYTNIKDFGDWRQNQINNSTLSEWSTVMIIKAINEPQVIIKNANRISLQIESSDRTEATLTPLFVGVCELDEINKENVNKYRFTLYKGRNGVDELEQLESSGWLQHNGLVSEADKFRFKYLLVNQDWYTVTYEIITTNGYQAISAPYTFRASRNNYADPNLASDKDVTILVEDQEEFCQENGCLRIKLNAPNHLVGCYVLTRTDEKSNFRVWDDLQYFVYNSDDILDWEVIYNDYTIESGIKYKYAIQQENAAGLRSQPLTESLGNPHYVDFQHSYLFSDGVQLKIEFNPKINSFKHTVLASKQDTLGDKYPHITKNGYAYYAEFPISGLISLQMDEDQTFFTLKTKEGQSDGCYYKGDLIIPEDRIKKVEASRGVCEPYENTIDAVENIYDSYSINSDLTDNNIYAERKFREKVEEFLNDFNYKLFRSATEGNIVVGLMNVSLTPHAELGRMIYDFSATAYEVADSSLESLDRNNIINIGGYQSLADGVIQIEFGQINEVYKSPRYEHNSEVYSLIKEAEEINIGGGYKRKVQRLRAFWIDRYPEFNLNPQLRELEAKRAQLLNEGELTTEIDNQIAEIKEIMEILTGPQLTTTILNVNGKNILVAPNRIYSLKQPVTSLSVVKAVAPIMVNYICEYTDEEDLTEGIPSDIDTTRIWGQVSGVFTGTDKVLKTYNFQYGPGKVPLRVYNGMPNKTVVYDKLGKILIDETNFNVYKTVNLMEVIKEQVRHQVELAYNVKDGFYQDERGRWTGFSLETGGKIYYDYSDMILFDIETEPGTVLYIGKTENKDQAKRQVIGPTGRYILNPMDNLVKYIALAKPAFALINYRCLTSQMTLKFKGENNVRSFE